MSGSQRAPVGAELLVGVVQRGRHPHHDGQGAVERQRHVVAAPQHLEQVGPVHVLHGEEVLAVLLAEVEHRGDVGVLQRRRDPRAVAHLGACLDHDAWDVRRLAADLLGRIGDGSAMGLLRAKLSTEGEPLVREAVARALELLEAGGGLRRTTPPPPLGPPK